MSFDDVGKTGVSDQSGYIALGFVLPKKLLKRAVDRNQIKRWTRGLLSGFRCSENLFVVVRPKTRFALRDMITREAVRADLLGLVSVWKERLGYDAA